MTISKRISVSVDSSTEEQLEVIMQYGECESVSNLFRSLIQKEYERLTGASATQNGYSDLSELTRKLNALMTVVGATDDKLYVLLDCFNNFLRFTEIENGTSYVSMDTELNSDNRTNVHEFIKRSEDNLNEKKRRKQLNG